MARKIIDIGVQGNDGTGDSIREAFRKVNDNFKDLYAILGSDEEVLSTILLDDFPNSWSPNTVLITDTLGENVLAKTLEAADTSIIIDNSFTDKITFRATGGKIIADSQPQLGGDLDGLSNLIANVANPDEYLQWNGQGSITADDVVITKGYADKRYVQAGGSGASTVGTIRLRDEPASASVHSKILGDPPINDGRLYIPSHGFNLGSNGAAFTYNSTGTFLTPLQEEVTAGSFVGLRAYKITQLGNTDWNNVANTVGKTYIIGDIIIAANTGTVTVPTGQTPSGKALPVYFIRYYNDNYLNLYYKIEEAKETDPDSIANSQNNRIIINPSADTICTGSISGTTLTISAISSGTVTIGSKVTGSGVTNETYITGQIGPYTGLAGNYTVSQTSVVGSITLTIKSVHTITDAYFNSTLAGNYLSNEALPRKNVVRRQGDTMTGPLYLYDHPGGLAGSGSPNGPDDLMAVTKFYVDNSSFSSDTNLYVSNSGDDQQLNVPVSKKGSALAYAYATIGAAAQRAEGMIELADNEPGPYRQKIYYTAGTTQTAAITTELEFASGNSGEPWAIEFKTLLERNIEWIKAETVSYINNTEPTLVYNQELCSRDIELILEAMKLDMLFASNWQSINAGRNYFKNSSAIVASTTQKQSTLSALNRVIECVEEALNNDPSVSSSFNSYQTTFYRHQLTGAYTNVNTAVITSAVGKIEIVKDIIDNYQVQGSASYPLVDYGTGTSLIKFTNGGVGADQGISTNIDIIPGKLLRGLKSGAIGRITEYNRLAGTDSNIPPNSVDTINVTLLTPIEFILGEELEFAESNKNLQITILVESGTYYEDLPIKVPPNVTIRGNDFRRCIVRPKNSTSSSPWVDTFFYRDSTFDGLDLLTTYNPYAVDLLTNNKEFLKREIIEWINDQIIGNISPFTSSFSYNSGKCSRDVGLIIDAIIHDIKFGGNGETYNAASLYWNGVISKIGASVLGTSQQTQTAAAIDELRNLIVTNILTNTTYAAYQSSLTQTTTSNNGEADAITKVTSLLTSMSTVITSGLSSLTTSFGDYESPKYGYHYLTNSTKPLNIGPSYTNNGSYENAAYMIDINKGFIQKEIPLFIAAVYPSFTFDSVQSEKDVGNIVDALVKDLKLGGKANVVDIAANYYGSGNVTISTEYKAGVQYIATLISAILADPDTAISSSGANNVNTAKKRNTTIDQLLDTNILVESGVSTIVTNLISSITYALTSANYTGSTPYNPPKNSNQLDVFMFNDAVRVSNITGQGHGGFMCVLDPSGSIGSKSPYVQESACFSASINKQAFRGGMFIDGFSGRLIAKITNVTGGGLNLTLEGLTKRRPIAPTAFYYNGFRYQIDNVISWTPSGAGVAEVELNPTTPWNNGNLQIILETPGNRSMLANDYTQVNDLGYGIVATNAGLTEQVSTFTYYCHTAYFANNGGQIRSVAGSNANGNFGLRAAGADPTELPDQVALEFDQTQPIKIFRYGSYSNSALENQIELYIKRYSYIPEAVSELDIEHDDGDSSRYEIRNITRTGFTDSQYSYRITSIDLTGSPVKVKLDAYQIGSSGISISAITRTDPCVITTSGAHNLVTGDFVNIVGVKGMTQINGGSYYVKVTSSTEFQIYKDSLNAPVDSTLYNTYVSDGTIFIGLKFYAGDMVYIDGLINSVELNRQNYLVVPTTTFNEAALYTSNVSAPTSSYTSGKLYFISDLSSASQSTWNTIAGTTNKTYVIGSSFVASATGTLGSGSITSCNSFRGSISSTTLTITTSYFGTLAAGQYLSGPGVKKGTKIVSGSGSTWTVNYSQNVNNCDIIFYQGLSNAGITAFGAGSGTHNGGAYVTNRQYMITSTGTFTNIGASANTLLTKFVATGAGTDGSAYYGGWLNETVKYRITDISSTSPAIVTFSEPVHFENGDILNIADTSLSLLNNTHYVRRGGSITVSAGNFIPGESYKITLVGNTDWAGIGATAVGGSFYNVTFIATGTGDSLTTGKAQLVTPLTPSQVALYSNETLVTPVSLVTRVSAGNFVIGKVYKIVYIGATDFTLIGASANLVGLIFTASGTGTAVSNGGAAFLQAFTANSTATNATAVNKGDLYRITSAGSDLTTLGADTTPSNDEIFQAVSPGSVLTSSTSTVQLLPTGWGGKEVLKLSLATNASDNRSGTGLTSQTPDHTNGAVRILQNMRFSGIENVNPTRPSTALELDAYSQHPSQKTLRVIAYNLTGATGSQLPDNTATITTDQTFNYVKPNSKASSLLEVDPDNPAKTLGGTIGDAKIAVDQITTPYAIDLLNTGTLQFVWAGKLHKVVSYTDAVPSFPAYITISDVYNNNNTDTTTGLALALPLDGTRTLRSGLPAGSSGSVTIKISTCRATGHDFLDIGTGGFNTSNYPTAIYGNPSIEPSDAYEIKEENKGRVFYVTSDQDGVFKVGPYFKVDQGTGTVTFSASIALSNLDGLGFKRGVTVSEFSTDSTMTNNAADTVPTQQAVRGYIDKRLGIDHNGTNVPVANKIGPGFLPLNGQNAMEANLPMGSNFITGLGTAGDSDTDYAASVGYVLSKLNVSDEFEELKDVVLRYGETVAEVGSASGTTLTVTGNTGSLFVDMPIKFESAIGTLSANRVYYVLGKTTTTFTVGVEKKGTAINVGTVSSITTDVYKVLTGQLAVLAGANNAVVYADVKGDIYSNYTADGITTLQNSIATDPDPSVAQSIVATGILVYDVSGFIRNYQIFGSSPGIAPKNYFQINQEIFSYTGIDDVPINPTYPYAGRLTGVTRAQKQSVTQTHAANDQVIPLHSARLDLQIAPEVIVNADVNPNAGILQSKLAMNAATTRANATGIAQADRGLASFDSSTFTATNGWITITNGSIGYSKIQNVDAGSLLGNLTGSAATIQHVTPENALKRGMWNFFSSGSTADTSYAFTFNKQTGGDESNFLTKLLISSTGDNNALVKTDGSGGIQVSYVKTNSYQNSAGSTILSLSGTNVTYSGSWSPGSGASFNATYATSAGSATTAGSTTTVTTGGSVTTTVISSGGAATAGTVTGDWTLTSGSKWQATYADLAEYYTSDQEYEPATVLVFGGLAETTMTKTFGDSRVAGVVTTNPAYTMNAGLDGTKVCIALQGRVPCKVVGKVKKGDLLTTSAIAGHAAKAVNPQVGTIIGKALEDKDYDQAGVIEVAVGRV